MSGEKKGVAQCVGSLCVRLILSSLCVSDVAKRSDGKDTNTNHHTNHKNIIVASHTLVDMRMNKTWMEL